MAIRCIFNSPKRFSLLFEEGGKLIRDVSAFLKPLVLSLPHQEIALFIFSMAFL